MNKMVNMVSVVSEVNKVNKVNEVTAANVTERNLGHELLETKTAIENALVKLDKADTLLNHWTQEYGFSEKPDPRAAVAYWSGANESREGEQAATWCWEYKKIFTVVEIAFDYILKAKEILRKPTEREV